MKRTCLLIVAVAAAFVALFAFASRPGCEVIAEIPRCVGSTILSPEYQCPEGAELLVLSSCGGIVHAEIVR